MKKLTVFCILSLMLALAALPSTAENTQSYEYTRNGYQATILQKHWDSFGHTYCGFDTPEELLQYTVDAMERIFAWGGGTKKLNAYRDAGNDVILSIQIITTSGMSHVVSNNYGKNKQMAVVALKDSYLSYHLAPIIHELTHVIYPTAYSRTLREGLASYMQDELGEYGTVHNYGLNPHEICQNVILPLASNQNLIGFVGSMNFGKTTAIEQRSAFYVASLSFMTYLIDTYGIDISLKIYSGMDEDIYIIQTGKTLEGIRSDWLLYLKQYASNLSAESIRQHVYTLAIEHGFPEEGALSFSEYAYHQFAD